MSKIIEQRLQELEKLKAEILYNNENGDNGNITLNQNASEYNMLKIFYKDESVTYSSVEVVPKENARIDLKIITSSNTSNTMTIKQKRVGIHGNKLENVLETIAKVALNNTISFSNENNIYITKVLGFKK